MEKMRVLCYGDSDTWGYIAGTGERRDARWTRVCQEALGDGYTVIENGLNGRTTVFDHPSNPWLNGLKGLGYALVSQKPLDMVVLFLGSNDVMYTDAEGSAAGVEKLIDAILDADRFCHVGKSIFPKGPKVLLLAPPLSAPEIHQVRPGSLLAEKAGELEKYAELFEAIAKKRGIHFLDAKLYTKSSPVDCIHIDGESHRALGEAVARKIRGIMESEERK